MPTNQFPLDLNQSIWGGALKRISVEIKESDQELIQFILMKVISQELRILLT
jgi:hypothetical protein